MDFYVFQKWELEQVLPWSHLKGPLPEATLKKHLAEAMSHTTRQPNQECENSLSRV
jgi:hypothetical protein